MEYLDPEDLETDGMLNNEIGYPNASHPSDHFSIGYKILLGPIGWMSEMK